jgi:23S rRNA pseudouridine1911/1915/1917 synthase
MSNHAPLHAEERDRGERLDVFLAARPEVGLSRAQIQRLIAAGKVQLNDRPAKAGQRLQPGDRIVWEAPPPVAYAAAAAEDIPLTVLYEDEDLLVVDKPAGLVVHPAAGHARGTLVNALLFHCQDLSGIGGVLRPGIVHRLDKGTSGLMVVAKSDAAHQGLAAQFKKHEVGKIYLALVYGNPREEEGCCEAPVGRDVADRKKMSTRSRRGKAARTHWRCLTRYGVATLLQVEIATGRTHQIRVHLQHTGYPIVGDIVYGGSKHPSTLSDTLLRAKLKALSRPALHAGRLTFTHPVTGAALSFDSPLPPDLADLCAFLQGLVTAPREA